MLRALRAARHTLLLLLAIRLGATGCATTEVLIKLHASDEPELIHFRNAYHLEEVAGTGTDLERLVRLTSWVHRQWEHDESNEPSASDPETILREAKEGKGFRCVEYAKVLAAVAQAVGFPARSLGLKRADAETAERGAGHTVTEVWLPSLRHWVMADAQFDVVARKGAAGLSAIELKEALDSDPADLTLVARTNTETTDTYYRVWIKPYLYYLDFATNQRHFDHDDPNAGGDTFKPKSRLMLVPPGAPVPHIFQRKMPLRDIEYTHDLVRFYSPPG